MKKIVFSVFCGLSLAVAAGVGNYTPQNSRVRSASDDDRSRSKLPESRLGTPRAQSEPERRQHTPSQQATAPQSNPNVIYTGREDGRAGTQRPGAPVNPEKKNGKPALIPAGRRDTIVPKDRATKQ